MLYLAVTALNYSSKELPRVVENPDADFGTFNFLDTDGKGITQMLISHSVSFDDGSDSCLVLCFQSGTSNREFPLRATAFRNSEFGHGRRRGKNSKWLWW